MADPNNKEVDVRAIAALAKLELTDQEVNRFHGEISAILAYADQLGELDLEGVEPTAHATRIVNVYRGDERGGTVSRETVLANAPAVVDDDLIKVPVVIDSGDQRGA